MSSRLLFVILIFVLLTGCTAPASLLPTASEPSPSPGIQLGVFSCNLPLVTWDDEARRHFLSIVDPISGEPVDESQPLELGINYFYVFSSDKQTLAAISYTGEQPLDPILHIIDLEHWKESRYELPAQGWPSPIVFSPDGSLLAVAYSYRNGSLLVFDIKQGKIRKQVDTSFEVTHLKFTQNGSSLMAYGIHIADRFTARERSDGFAQVALFTAMELELQWSVELQGVREGIYSIREDKSADLHQPGNSIFANPAVVFAPENDQLHIIHADENNLTMVDFSSREVLTHVIQPKLSWFERFLMMGTGVVHAKVANGASRRAVISPDGKVLFSSGTIYRASQQENGEWKFTSTPLGLQAIRVSDGQVLAQKDIFSETLISTPKNQLLIHGWSYEGSDDIPSTRILNFNDLSLESEYQGEHLFSAFCIDGRLILVSALPLPEGNQATRMSVRNFPTGGLLAEWTIPTYAAWLTVP